MKAKFLFPVSDVRIAPNSVVVVDIKDADHNNTWFIFPASNIAERWLCLSNAGLLMWPAKAVLVNPRDVAVNVSEKEPVAVSVIFDWEGLEMEELEMPAEETVEPNENPEGSTEESEAPAENVASEAENTEADEVASVETDEAPEEKPAKKGRRK